MGNEVNQGAGFFLKKRAINRFASLGLRCRPAGKEQVGEPQSQAIDQNAGVRCRQFVQLCGEVEGFLDATPFWWPTFAMVSNPAAHFAVTRFRRRQINDVPAGFRGAFFSQQALARTGTTEDQFFHGSNFR